MEVEQLNGNEGVQRRTAQRQYLPVFAACPIVATHACVYAELLLAPLDRHLA
jgi:hypothetical protein